jgi:hypothetical protein
MISTLLVFWMVLEQEDNALILIFAARRVKEASTGE